MEFIKSNNKINVLITGVAGFIGSNIAEKCLELGFNVRGVDNFANGSRENIEAFLKNDKFEFIEGDICDYKTCDICTKNIDYVYHEAAWNSIPKSVAYPLEYSKNNILGMHNMLHASYVNGVKRFIYASSASVYGDDDHKVKQVDIEGRVLSPYALSKRAGEELAKLYYSLYGLKTIGLRYFNVFGKRQNPNLEYAAVIPKFIKAILNNNVVTIFGDGEQSRDFTYVENVIHANINASFAKEDAWGKVFNVACGNTTSVNQLYQYISQILNKETTVEHLPERKGEMRNSLADISKTKSILNYEPKVSIYEGLEKTILWFKERYGLGE